MSDKSDADKPGKAVAPGYPAVETLKSLDVSGWEPAVVFHPVDLSDTQDGGNGQ